MKWIVFCGWFFAHLLKNGTEGKFEDTDEIESNILHDNSALQYYSLNPSFLKPLFMHHVALKHHVPGLDVILPCMAVGVKPITYSWFLNGELLVKKQRIKFPSNRSMLKIKRVRERDIGTYTCIASNSYGNLSYSFDVKIQEKQKQPLFYDHDMMVRQQVAVHPSKDTARLPCQAESKAPVHYLWLKDGVPYLHVKPRHALDKEVPKESVVSEPTGDLVIKNLKVRDAGKYTCVAFNRYGNVSFTYELRIVLRRSGGPPQVIPFTRPTVQQVPIGTSISLDCLETMSSTLPDVRWFHLYEDGDRNIMPTIPGNIDWENFVPESLPFHADYVPAHRYETFRVLQENHTRSSPYVHDDTDPYGMRLALANVTKEDGGAYVCLVSNSDGYDFATFYLRVTEAS